MKGEALNIEDIEQRVKSVINEAEVKIRNFSSKNIEDIGQEIKSGAYKAEEKVRSFANKNADNIRGTANEISSSAKNLFKIIGKILGFFMIFASLCAIVTILLVWFVPIPSIFNAEPEFSIFCVREVFTIFGLNSTASFLCIICILLPLTLVFLSGISFVISRLRKPMGIALLCIFIVWISASVFFAIGMTTFVGDKITTSKVFIEEDIQFPSPSQTIVIKSNTDKIPALTKIRFLGKHLYIESETAQNQIYGVIRLDDDIVYTNDSVVTVRIYKENCKEKTMCEFQNNIKMEDSVLYIPYLFPLQKNYWSGEKIKVKLFIPRGKQLIVEEPFVWGKKICSE
jgi:hypothetical protein